MFLLERDLKFPSGIPTETWKRNGQMDFSDFPELLPG